MEFKGYLRPDGQVGIRNYTVVLPTIGCANELAWEISECVEGVTLLTHNHACIRVGKDQERAHHTLRSILRNPNVGGALIIGLGCVKHMMDEIERYGVDILGSEPTQGNIKNGLTTIEEKSLGAILKGGTTSLVDVLEYGQKPDKTGLYFMDGTTQASQLFLGMFAAGAQIQIFSYAGGLPARIRGLPSYPPGLSTLPILKVLGSCADADEKEHFDVYAGGVLTAEESIDQVGQRIFDTILAVASGELCYTEKKRRYTEMLQVYADGLLM